MKEEKRRQWKPGQLVTIQGRVFRIKKNPIRKHSFLGALWEDSPCIKCIGVNKNIPVSICCVCAVHCVKHTYIEELHPKKSKG